MEPFRPGGAASGAASSTVELSISCRNLVDADVFSKSDPVVVLFVKEFGKDSYVEYGRTEVIDNNLNPDFVKKFILNYFFEERQLLKFEVYDVDSKSADLRNHDFLGRIECTLGEVVSSGKLQKNLQGPKVKSGCIITVSAEELSSCKEELTLQFKGSGLDKKDFFGKSDPFLAFYKVNEDTSYTVVHRTEVIKNTLNPVWKQFSIPLRVLCGGDSARTIQIKCFDWNKNGNEDLIGEFLTNADGLLVEGSTFELINPVLKAKKGKSYKHSGVITVAKCSKRTEFSFLDYIQAGTQLNCTIAIDFTASNGNPTQQNSLHFISPYQPNQYSRALQAVGEIIQDYDSDKLFPVLGFGARLPPDGRVSHEFFVNGHPTNPYVNGIQGVLEAYRKCLMAVQLYGPTNFAPCINHVARFAAAKRDGSQYFILLILTDGVITDMPATTQAIVMAASLPLSIIIVGIGNADFGAMKELDGDDIRLSYAGRTAERDIVQFVPFRDFIAGNTGSDMQVSQARLAKEVLAEIPEQFMSFMKANGVQPGSWHRSSGVQPNGYPMSVPTNGVPPNFGYSNAAAPTPTPWVG